MNPEMRPVSFRPSRTRLCTTCCASDPPELVTPGSFTVTVILFCIGVVPGLVYEFWRVSSRFKACRHCGCRTFAPSNAPIFRGRRGGVEEVEP